jgi:hypothetical protein
MSSTSGLIHDWNRASGPEWNVLHWLEKQSIPTNAELVEKILTRAKHMDRLLTDAEMLELCG